MNKPAPAPFNGMPAHVFHYHTLTPEGRTMLRELRAAKAEQEGEPLEYVRWRSTKGKMWFYTVKSVYAA